MSDENTPFDLITVTLGSEEIRARPVDWEYDENGNPGEPTKCETTCPQCSQLMQFEVSELVAPPYNFVVCENCGAGKDHPGAEEEEVEAINHDEVKNADALASKETEITINSSTSKLRNPLEFDYAMDNIEA